MSNTYRIVCTHHTPRISSDDLGGVRVIAEVQALYAQRTELLDAITVLDHLGLDTHSLGVGWELAVVRFFRQHPTCALALADETGRHETPLGDPAPADDTVDAAKTGRSK